MAIFDPRKAALVVPPQQLAAMRDAGLCALAAQLFGRWYEWQFAGRPGEDSVPDRARLREGAEAAVMAAEELVAAVERRAGGGGHG